ncbi:MAG: type II toxin-antitoxin system VapC family toxin [PVC group bacterium]
MFLDTSFWIDLLREQKRDKRGPAVQKLETLAGVELFSSVFALGELQTGARLSTNPRRELQRVNSLFKLLTVVYPDYSFAASYGEAESTLRKKGISIPTMDLLIGVTAKMHGLPLITRDITHFQRIQGLRVEGY